MRNSSVFIWALLPLVIGTVEGSEVGLGIAPDCGEKASNFDEIINIANRRSISNQTEFQSALPSGTLQSFTFITGQDSEQGEGIKPGLPGVLRFSADGKIQIRYVCDKTSKSYNTIEIIRFDETKDPPWTTTHIDFRKRPGFQDGPIDNRHQTLRVAKNPKSCLNCHSYPPSANNIRPNMEEYDFWPDLEGANDDIISKAVERDPTGPQRYEKFRRTQKNNPCYSTLPWPKHYPKGYENYPYRGADENDKNYTLRPNTRLTQALSKLAAERIVLRFKRKPKVMALVLQEAFHCEFATENRWINASLKTLLPNFRPVQESPGDPFGNNPKSRSPSLYSASRSLGIEDSNWTLSFKTPSDPAFKTGGVPIWQQVQGGLIRELKKLPELKEIGSFLAKESYKNLDCIGEYHPKDVVFESKEQQLICKTLKSFASQSVTNEINETLELNSHRSR